MAGPHRTRPGKKLRGARLSAWTCRRDFGVGVVSEIRYRSRQHLAAKGRWTVLQGFLAGQGASTTRGASTLADGNARRLATSPEAAPFHSRCRVQLLP